MRPDFLIGHSVGELACAYADTCLTAEQTIRMAYARGKCIEDATLPLGAMAICGLSWERAQRTCPPTLSPSSHNGADCSTISGPRDDLQHFVAQLNAQGITAVEVDSTNIPLNSKCMSSLAPEMKRLLGTIIAKPGKRSSRWITTTQPTKHRWIGGTRDG